MTFENIKTMTSPLFPEVVSSKTFPEMGGLEETASMRSRERSKMFAQNEKSIIVK